MTNEFGFDNGKKLNINDFRRQVREGKLSKDEKFKKILSAFDVNKNGFAEDVEIEELFGKMSNFAVRNGNSVFEEDEINDFLEATHAGGKSLKAEGISANELLGFFKVEDKTVNAETKVSETQQGRTEEIKNETIEFIEGEFKNGMSMLTGYDEGIISRGFDGIKEFLGSRLTKSNVARNLYVKLETAQLLKRAKNGELTYKQYFSAIKGVLYDIFPGTGNLSEKNEKELKQRIEALSPEQVERNINKILSLPNPDSKEYKGSLYNYMNDFTMETSTTHSVSRDGRTITAKTINEPYKSEGNDDRLMTFEEVFKFRYGKEFDAVKFEELNSEKVKLSLMSSTFNAYKQIYSVLRDEILSCEGLMEPGRGNELTQNQHNLALQGKLIEVMNNLGLPDDESRNDFLSKFAPKDIEIKDSKFRRKNGNNELGIGKTDITIYEMVNIAKSLLSYLEKNVSSEQDLAEQADKTDKAYRELFGDKDANSLVNAYKEDSENAVQTLRTGIEVTGGAAMIVGMIVYTPLAIAGAVVGSTGGIAAEAINEISKKQPRGEKLKELGIELAQNAALFAAGAGAGRAGMSTKALLIAQKCPKLVACISDVGVDVTLSAISNLIITGDLQLEGEGIAQIVSLIAGHIKAGRFKSLHVKPKSELEPVTQKPKTDFEIKSEPEPVTKKHAETKINKDKIIEQAHEYGISRENVQKLNGQAKARLAENLAILEAVIKDLPKEQAGLVKKLFADNPGISKFLSSKNIREVVADMDFSKIQNGKNIKRSIDNAAISHNFKIMLREIGVDDEAVKTLLARFMIEASNRIDSDMQADITDAQLKFIKDRGATTENTYILAPQPTGTANLKSYTNSARDFVEISQTGSSGLKLNPDNAAVEINNRKLFTGDEQGKKFIVISDDCSISGASILEDSLKNINLGNNLKVGQDVEIVFAPTVIGGNAQKNINKFIDLYEKISPDDIRELEKRITKASKSGGQPDLAGLSDDAVEMYKLVKYDITDNHNDRNQQNIIIKMLKNCKCNKGGKVTFSLADVSGQYPAQKALDYRETETYKNAAPDEKNEIDTWMTADGQTWGYRQNATMVSIEGYRSKGYDFIGNTTNKDSKRAFGIDDNNQTRTNLPVRGNAPNNNTVLSQIFARAAGVNNSRIKVSGLIPPESYYKLMMHDLTTLINPTYIGNQRVGKSLSLEFDIKKGGLSDGKIKIGNKSYDAENCKIEIMTEKGNILYSQTLHGVPKGTPMAQTAENYRKQLNPDVINDSGVSVLYGAKKIEDINDKVLEELGIQENYVFAVPKEYSDKIVVKVNGEVIIP